MGYFDRVTVSLHILYTANQETEGSQDRLAVLFLFGTPFGRRAVRQAASENMACGYSKYRKSSIKHPRGLFFSSTFEGGGGLIERGGFFNLAKRITCSKNTVV